MNEANCVTWFFFFIIGLYVVISRLFLIRLFMKGTVVPLLNNTCEYF